MNRAIRKAFTLVEILIVVVILGILAAVVVPQFVNASDEAQVGNVETQLQTLRTQIQLFRASDGSNAYPLDDTLWEQLIDAALIQEEPINPRTNSTVVVGGSDAAAAEADLAEGWHYDAATGQLWASGFNEDFRQEDPVGEPWTDAAAGGGGAGPLPGG
ncbi:MAG: prepilin-type N-terminal cleavage/methylation domain-containing protein [Planctomycetota bacterium]